MYLPVFGRNKQIRQATAPKATLVAQTYLKDCALPQAAPRAACERISGVTWATALTLAPGVKIALIKAGAESGGNPASTAYCATLVGKIAATLFW